VWGCCFRPNSSSIFLDNTTNLRIF
jgi:hypothetical protein